MKLYIGNALKDKGQIFPLKLKTQFFARDIQAQPFPLLMKGNYYSVGRSIMITSSFQFTLNTCCDRCLKPFIQSFKSISSEVFFSANAEQRVYHTRREGSLKFLFSGNEIILDNWIRQTVLLSLPSRILCDPSCKGLCSQCGQDLNRAPCVCSAPAGRKISL